MIVLWCLTERGEAGANLAPIPPGPTHADALGTMASKSLKNTILIAVAATAGFATIEASASADTSGGAPTAKVVADPGLAIVTRSCQACHDLGTVTETRHTAQEWTGVIERMRGNGADLSDDEAKQAQAYLAKMYGKPG